MSEQNVFLLFRRRFFLQVAPAFVILIAVFYFSDFFIDCFSFRIIVENIGKHPLNQVSLNFNGAEQNASIAILMPKQRFVFFGHPKGESGPKVFFTDYLGKSYQTQISEYLEPNYTGSIRIFVADGNKVVWSSSCPVPWLQHYPLKQEEALVFPNVK